MVDPLSNLSFQPVLHDWYNKCRGMCCPVGMVHIKKSSICIAAAGFLSHYLNGPLQYVRRHKTVNKMC